MRRGFPALFSVDTRHILPKVGSQSEIAKAQDFRSISLPTTLLRRFSEHELDPRSACRVLLENGQQGIGFVHVPP